MTSVQTEPVGVNRSQPGETLRKAREGRGMALDDVAVALNLSTTALKNMEAGAFDRLPGHTFARGYIRAYAKLLGMDQELLVREFDQVTGTNALGSSVSSVARIVEPARVSHGLLRMVSLSVLVILVLAGFLWWQDSTSQREDTAQSPGLQPVGVERAAGTTPNHPLEPEDLAVELDQQLVVVAPVELTTLQDNTLTAAPEVAGLELTAPAAAPAPVEPQSAADSATLQQAESPTTAEPIAAAPAVSNNQVVLASGEGLLSIHFTSNCWTQVSDADGKVLLSALRRPGEDINLAAKLPLELRLGYASGAQVSFNGKSVDMQPFTTGETARLKLGQ